MQKRYGCEDEDCPVCYPHGYPPSSGHQPLAFPCNVPTPMSGLGKMLDEQSNAAVTFSSPSEPSSPLALSSSLPLPRSTAKKASRTLACPIPTREQIVSFLSPSRF